MEELLCAVRRTRNVRQDMRATKAVEGGQHRFPIYLMATAASSGAHWTALACFRDNPIQHQLAFVAGIKISEAKL